jgi:hypothetical protein
MDSSSCYYAVMTFKQDCLIAGRSGEAHCLTFTNRDTFILGGKDLIQVWNLKVRSHIGVQFRALKDRDLALELIKAGMLRIRIGRQAI